MALAKIAQEILQHASTGPSETPGEKVRNQLSPHMENLIVQLIRQHIIGECKKLEAVVAQELDSMKNIMPELLQRHVEVTAARVNSFIQHLYK